MVKFRKHKLAMAILPLSIFMTGCDEDNADPFAINAPDTYEFNSQRDGRIINSVNFTDAATRLLLIKELSHLIESDYLQQVGENQGAEAVKTLLNTIYEGGTFSNRNSLASSNIYNRYDPENTQEDGSTPILGLTDDTDLLEVKLFSDVSSNVNLKSLMPGIGAPLIQESDGIKRFIGWTFLDVSYENTADYLIQKWFSSIASIATDGNLNTKFISTLNYKVLIEDFLVGSIAYMQAINTHLNADIALTREEAQNQTDYSLLASHWDMAFGYFGAPIHGKTLTLSELTTINSQDSNGDGLIHYAGEYNFWPSQNAASRDIASIYSTTRFSKNINDAFLVGRTLMDESLTLGEFDKTRLSQELQKNRNTIIQHWDAALAAKLIHHINAIGAIAQYWELGEVYDNTYIQHWSELKATILIMQFNPHTKISLEQFESFNQDIEYKPNKSPNINLFLSKLFNMRETLQELYGFTNEDTENW